MKVWPRRSGAIFAVVLHSDLIEFDRTFREVFDQARSGHDGMFAQSPSDAVVPAGVCWQR